MFASHFSEGDSTLDLGAAPHTGQSEESTSVRSHRRRINMIDDFDIVHNIIYYIYTNRITLSTSISENSKPGSESTLPKVCDAEDIYALAHRLDLESLKEKALGFLKRSCNSRNILHRVLSKFASIYEEVGAVYEDFFRAHWREVRETTEFTSYFAIFDEVNDVVETGRIFKKFR